MFYNLTELFISFNSVFVYMYNLGLSTYNIMKSVNKVLLFPFQYDYVLHEILPLF